MLKIFTLNLLINYTDDLIFRKHIESNINLFNLPLNPFGETFFLLYRSSHSIASYFITIIITTIRISIILDDNRLSHKSFIVFRIIFVEMLMAVYSKCSFIFRRMNFVSFSSLFWHTFSRIILSRHLYYGYAPMNCCLEIIHIYTTYTNKSA